MASLCATWYMWGCESVTRTRLERHAMGESQCSMFQPEFNKSIRVEARPQRLSADGGALLLRELMDRSRLTALLETHLVDSRDPGRVEHGFVELLRTWLLLIAQGWQDQTDVELLRADPILRLAVADRRGAEVLTSFEALCSQPTLSRLLRTLSAPGNREGLGQVLLALAALRQQRNRARVSERVLDLDSLPLTVYGTPPGSAYNAHFHARCYHPILVSSDGEFLAAKLRPGEAHTAGGGLEFVLPVVRWAQEHAERVWLRMDAGFPSPELLQELETVDCRYVARVRANQVLQRAAEPFLTRPAGRPPAEERQWFHEFSYQAVSWPYSRRAVLVVIDRPGELFLDYFFLLTNAAADEMDAATLLQFYRQRGGAEQDFGDWKSAFDLALSSTPRPKTHYRGRQLSGPDCDTDSFAANEAKLLLSLVAANLMHDARTLLEHDGQPRASRSRTRQLLLKTAARVTLGKRYITVQIDAARASLWSRFSQQLERIPPVRGSPCGTALPSRA